MIKHRLISYTLRPVLFIWLYVTATLTIYTPERGIYGFINVLYNFTCRNKACFIEIISSWNYAVHKKNPVFKNIVPSVSSIWAESSPFSVVCATIPAPGKQRGSRIQGDPLRHNQI